MTRPDRPVPGASTSPAGAQRPGRRSHRKQLADVFVVAALASIPLTVAVRELLPPRFSYDSATIQKIAAGQFAPTFDLSYYNVGRLYEALGMADALWAAAALGIAFGVLTLWAALRHARGPVTPFAIGAIALYVLLVSVYLAQFSKDVWVVPVIVVALLAPAGLWGEVALVVSMAAYASNFRTYWFLVLVIYAAMRVVTWHHRSRRAVLGIAAGVVIGVTILAPALLGKDIQNFREGNNLGRATAADSATLIVPPQLGDGPLANSAENVLTLAGLVIPGPLALLGSPLYVLYAIGIGGVWVAFARTTLVGRPRVFDGGPSDGADDRPVRWALLMIAYVVTQGFFEPDYGSYLRHLTPVLPLLIATGLRQPGSPFCLPVASPDPDVARAGPSSHVGASPNGPAVYSSGFRG